MNDSLDETPTDSDVRASGHLPVDQQRLIELAQASIDGYRDSELTPNGLPNAADQAELEKLSTVLDLVGSLGAESSASNVSLGDEPLKIGRYEVIGERGRGGFGIVLRAWDALLQREVALKIPKPERLLAGQALDELVREARMVAKLSHPGIVRVYEVRRWGPLWYIASDYCDGPTLAEWLEARRGSFSLPTAVEIMAATADAVHYAHSRGVLHLDLKPENILLDVAQEVGAPRPMVTDFGLSHEEGAQIGSQGRIGGTLTYMAPEQEARDGERIGVATDVYALGVILAELTHAVHGSNGEFHRDEGAADFNWPRQAPPDLVAVCKRCLAVDPLERYQSAREFADDLRRYLQGKPVTARPRSWPFVAAYYCRRKPFVSTMIVALAATIIISGVAVLAAWREAERHLASLTISERRQREAADRTEKSLLRLASFAQEAKLRMAHAHDETGLVFPDMKEFLLEARRWADAEPEGSRLNQGVEAAVKSMSLLDETEQASEENSKEQLRAGVAAWLELIRQSPQETRWRQALALHLFTHKLREADDKWLSWRSSGLIAEEPIRRSLETPYALLLIDYARTRARHQSARVSYDMLASALEILSEENNASVLNAQQRLYWRLMANQLAATAAKECWRPEANAAHLAEATRLIEISPAPTDCDARLAALIGELCVNRASTLIKIDDEQARGVLELATAYGARAAETAPDSWLYQIALVDQRRRLANLHRRNDRTEASLESLNLAVQALDGSVARCGHMRPLLRERAEVLAFLAEDHLALNHRTNARQTLERSIADFAALDLTSHDSLMTWLRYGKALLTLTKIYAEEGRNIECQETFSRLNDLMTRMQSFTNHHRMQSFVRQARLMMATLLDKQTDEASSL